MDDTTLDTRFFAALIENLKVQIRECYGAYSTLGGEAQASLLQNYGPYSTLPFVTVWQSFASPQLILLVRKMEALSGASFVDWFDDRERPDALAELLKRDLASLPQQADDLIGSLNEERG